MNSALGLGTGNGSNGELARGFPASYITERSFGFSKNLNWKNFQSEILLNYIENIKSGQADTVTTFGSLSGTIKWSTGILAPNRKIFCCPVNSATILIIDTTNDSTTAKLAAPGGAATTKYFTGCFSDNEFVYMIPASHTAIARINPYTNEIKTFGNIPGTLKWLSSVVAPNGKIYCPPYNESSILVVDPNSDTFYTFGNLGTGTGKWRTSTLAPNGKIYCMPTTISTGDRILVIDPSNDSYYFLPSPAGLYHVGATLYTDGMIYGSPFTTSTGIMKIDPFTDTVSKPISFVSATYDAYHMSLLPNGKMYARQNGIIGIFRFDPRTLSHDKTITDAGTTSKSNANVLAQNGQIYCIPSSATTVLKVGTSWPIDANAPLSAEYNKG